LVHEGWGAPWRARGGRGSCLSHTGAPGCGGRLGTRSADGRPATGLARGAVLGAATGEGLERRVCAAESA